ncbi:MAG: cell division protein FtsZ [Mollicutes bacterium]|nr:MAG: cell division protein FtsZ [Mollicutes bacterium]
MTPEKLRIVKIKVIGIGGAGCNAVNHMIDYQVEGVEFTSANTDSQALLNSFAEDKIMLGAEMLKGIGAGGDPLIGEKAAIESEKEIRQKLENIDLLFIVCGLGGGTGTGASPVIARIAQEMNILVVAAVTKPFSFEGRFRSANADKGIQNLKKYVDSMIIIANDKLLETQGNYSLDKSFNSADENLRLAIQTISELVVMPAKINLDFADVKRVFTKKKNALFGVGVSEGKRKAIDATREAIKCNLLEASIKGVKNAIVNFTGGPGTTLFDINDSIDYLKKQAGEEVNIIFGLKINKEMGEKMMVAIIATDFNEGEIKYANPDMIEQIRKSRELEEKKLSSDTNENDISKTESSSTNDANLNFSDNDVEFRESEETDDDVPPFMRE